MELLRYCVELSDLCDVCRVDHSRGGRSIRNCRDGPSLDVIRNQGALYSEDGSEPRLGVRNA